MSKISRIIWGIVLIALGFIFLLNALEITKINIFFNGWWTLLIIIPCLIDLINPNKEDKMGDIIGILIGIILLLLMQRVLNITLVIKLFIPAIFLIGGLYLVFGSVIKKDLNSKIKDLNTNKYEEFCSVFSSQSLSKDDKFKQINLDAVFGSLTFDLKDADISEESLINISAIFGEVKLIVPKNVTIKVKSTPIFGDISNKCKNKDGKKVIYINALALFGSVEIDD